MAKHENFRPIVGPNWIETTSDDNSVLNELKRLGLAGHLRKSKTDLTMFGINKRLVLQFDGGKAILVWEKQHFLLKKLGIRCVLFANTSKTDSKTLLLEATKLARYRWIESPFFVELDNSTHPIDADTIFRDCAWHELPKLQHQKNPVFYTYQGSILDRFKEDNR